MITTRRSTLRHTFDVIADNLGPEQSVDEGRPPPNHGIGQPSMPTHSDNQAFIRPDRDA